MLKEEFNKLKTPEELMEFMDNNIEYGYINVNGERVTDLKTFENDYKVNTIDQVLSSGLALCIEQAYLQKRFFDMNGIENRMFAFRIYEKNEIKPENLDDIHVFTLYKSKDNWNLFEHSRTNFKGIREYGSVEEALKDSVKNLREDEILTFIEIDDCIEDVTYADFNLALDEIEKNKKGIDKFYK